MFGHKIKRRVKPELEKIRYRKRKKGLMKEIKKQPMEEERPKSTKDKKEIVFF
jgi:hypothetical protein